MKIAIIPDIRQKKYCQACKGAKWNILFRKGIPITRLRNRIAPPATNHIAVFGMQIIEKIFLLQ